MPGDHQWVEISMTPVEASVEGDEVIIHASEAAISAASEDKRYGCWHCDQPLTSDNVNNECPGAGND